jgi:enamine deaminase RidA (YjgF/YER057c/UK114 family)
VTSGTDDRVRQLGLELPPAVPPLASYVPLVVTGRLAFVSGHGPLGADKRPAFAGQIGQDLSESDAEEAARLTTLNLLATLQHGLGSLDVIDQIAQVRCFIVSAPATRAHKVVPAAVAELLGRVFGADRSGCYSTIGISASVLDLPVTIDLVAVISR